MLLQWIIPSPHHKNVQGLNLDQGSFCVEVFNPSTDHIPCPVSLLLQCNVLVGGTFWEELRREVGC